MNNNAKFVIRTLMTALLCLARNASIWAKDDAIASTGQGILTLDNWINADAAGKKEAFQNQDHSDVFKALTIYVSWLNIRNIA